MNHKIMNGLMNIFLREEIITQWYVGLKEDMTNSFNLEHLI